MKKQSYTYVLYPLVIVALILTLPLLRSRPKHNLDSMLFVKAAHFDKKDGKWLARLYCTDAESTDAFTFYGEADTPERAASDAKDGSYKNLYFPSAQMLLLGDGIGKDELLELASYAIATNGFPLSVPTFYGKAELAGEKYVMLSDALKARELSEDLKLWRYADILLAENEMPSVYHITEGSDGKIYFEKARGGYGK